MSIIKTNPIKLTAVCVLVAAMLLLCIACEEVPQYTDWTGPEYTWGYAHENYCMAYAFYYKENNGVVPDSLDDLFPYCYNWEDPDSNGYPEGATYEIIDHVLVSTFANYKGTGKTETMYFDYNDELFYDHMMQLYPPPMTYPSPIFPSPTN